MGYQKSAQWLLLGEKIDAQQAEKHGLINELTDDPLRRARETCEALAKQPPEALRQCKHLLRRSQQSLVSEAMDAEIEVFTAALKQPEFAEAAAAFFEKRPADFTQFE